MYIDDFKHQLPDIDEAETREWIESLDQVLEQAGENRARFLMYKLLKRARQLQIGVPALTQTRYINTHQPRAGAVLPRRRGARAAHPPADPLERGGDGPARQRALPGHRRPHVHVRVGGDPVRGGLQPLLPRQGPSRRRRPGLLPGPRGARHLRPSLPRGPSLGDRPRPLPARDRRRRSQLVSAPAPDAGLLGVPDGLDGPRARWPRSTRPASTATSHNRGIRDTSAQRVWAYLGDGEMDEPESITGIALAARDGLDNLTFVVNCNLQRLDGPVRGNGKVIQELEGLFRGAGWNVIKVIWGREWDELLARDVDGVLVEKMNTTVDGEFQKYSMSTGLYVREHFFGPDPRLRAPRRPPDATAEHRAPAARRPRLPQGLRRIQGGDRVHGRPDRDPGQDRQGLDAGQGRRGAQLHPPGEEDARGRAARVPRPPGAADPRRPAPRGAVLPPGLRLRGGRLHDRAAGGPRRVRPAARRPRRCRCPRPSRRSTPSSPPAARRPCRRRWCSRALLRNLIRDPEIGQADRADHPGRGADLRSRPAVQGGRHLRRPRPALRRRWTRT